MLTFKTTKTEKLNNFLNRKSVQDWIKSVTGLDTLKLVIPNFLKCQENGESYNFIFEDVMYRVGLEKWQLYVISSKKHSKEAIINSCPFKFE